MRTMTEGVKIHNELFKKSLHYDYYELGVSHGMYIIYKIMNKYKHQNFTGEEIMEMIKNSINQNETIKIKEYFDRLMIDLNK